MASDEIQARHVFHAQTTGWDRIHAWQETTGEPVFVWGRRSGGVDGGLFLSVKQAFSKWLRNSPEAGLTIYHDGVGADALGPLDPCPHKVLFHHHWFPRWERNFEWNIRCTGKLIVGHPELIKTVRERFGWVPERYIQSMSQPVLSSPGTGSAEHRPAKARTGIWLHGRQWRRYGNRLRAIADRWPEEAGQLEIIAEGSGRPRWARKDHIVWSMNMPFEFAHLRVFTWDSTLLLNDYSLDAPWLMHALARNCFPLVPEGDGHTRTSEWRAEAAPQPYPWGDFPAALELLQQWRLNRTALQPHFETWRRGILGGSAMEGGPGQPATVPEFSAKWADVKANLIAQRPPKLRRRKPVPFWYPVGWYERVQRLRAGL